MLSRKALAIATLCTIVCTRAGIAEEGFKSSEFLRWSPEKQSGYIATSAMMAGVIATQNRPDQAKCIDKWIAENEPGGFAKATQVMARFPDHHPTGVIAAILEKACGSIKYTSR